MYGVCAGVCGYAQVCAGKRKCTYMYKGVRGWVRYARVSASVCVLDEFSEYLLETRVNTSADFNTYPIWIFLPNSALGPLHFKRFQQAFHQIFCSRGCLVEHFYGTSSRFWRTSIRNSTGHLVEIYIAFLDEIGNSKTFEAYLQNSSGRPVES